MFTELISLESYNLFLWIMAGIAMVVFVALYFVEAGVTLVYSCSKIFLIIIPIFFLKVAYATVLIVKSCIIKP